MTKNLSQRNKLYPILLNSACLLAFALVQPRANSAKPADLKTAVIAEEVIYQGMCDASAAAPLDGNLFVVASDEENRLRVYHRGEGGPPRQTFDLTGLLTFNRLFAETDLEGAARLGDHVYWIASHARNSDGKFRPNRHRFFATKFVIKNGRVQMEFAGTPYENLVEDLINAPELARFDLASAAQLPPKAPGGLNIEGLCSTPDGQLLIGFRNPVPQERALLVPLKNPKELVAGQRAKFGPPILLNLDGLGIRDIAFHDGRFAIVGGPFDGSGRSKLFSWAGGSARPHPFKHVKLRNLNPEALVVYPDLGWREFQLFSDDSGQSRGDKKCRDLKDERKRTFRSVWIIHEAESAP